MTRKLKRSIWRAKAQKANGWRSRGKLALRPMPFKPVYRRKRDTRPASETRPFGMPTHPMSGRRLALETKRNASATH